MLISKHLISHFFPEINEFSYQEIENAMLKSGIEIEDYEEIIFPTNLSYGIIKNVSLVEDSKKLKLCTVFLPFENLTLQIVCGGNNVRENLKVLVAKNGAELLNKKIKIIPRKVFNIESDGMICAYKELYESRLLNKSMNSVIPQIMELDEDWDCFKEYKPQDLCLDDCIFSLSIPVNRRDLNSAWSISEELKKNLNKQSNKSLDLKISDFESWKIKSILLTNNIVLNNEKLNLFFYIFLAFNEWVDIDNNVIIDQNQALKNKKTNIDGNEVLVHKKSNYFLANLCKNFLEKAYKQEFSIPNFKEETEISFLISWSKVLKLLNQNINHKEKVIKKLTNFNFVFQLTEKEDVSNLFPPKWRNDLNNENNFLNELSIYFDLNKTAEIPIKDIVFKQNIDYQTIDYLKKIKDFFISNGFIECNTFNLQNIEEIKNNIFFEDRIFEVLINNEKNQNSLRKHGLLELVKVLEYNQQHKNELFPVFELINICNSNNHYWTLNIVVPTISKTFALNNTSNSFDIYDLSALLKRLFFHLGFAVELEEDQTDLPLFAKTQKLKIISNKNIIGYLGNIYISNQIDMSGCLLKLDFFNFSKLNQVYPTPFSSYPPCYKDISIKIKELKLPKIKEIIDLIKVNKFCQDCVLINQYKTDNYTSYLFRYKLQSFDRTLSNTEIQEAIKSIEETLKNTNLQIQ